MDGHDLILAFEKPKTPVPDPAGGGPAGTESPMHPGSLKFRLLGLMATALACTWIDCGGGAGSGTGQPASVAVVAVSPASLTVAAGAQVQYSATVAGTGAFNPTVAWSAQRGSITATGLYTAPAATGADRVTAASVQDPAVSASASLAVAAAGTVAAPVLTCPVEVQAQGGPYGASAVVPVGVGIQWAIAGGTLVGGATGASVQFQPGPGPFATLTCTAGSGSGSATVQRTLVVLPFAPRDYLADLKGLLAANQGAIAAEAASGDPATYYNTSYYLMGMAAAAQGTGDAAVMATLAATAGQMIAKAQPLVRNGITYPEWGPWDANGNPQQLNTFQATAALARTAAVIAGNPAFKAKYGAQLDQLVAFVDQSIFGYWFDKKTGVYADPGSLWLGGAVPWLPVDLGGWGTYTYWIDSCSQFGAMAAWMYQATGNLLYLEYATRVAEGFQDRVSAASGAWVWDQGAVPIVSGGNQDGSPDTSHANREAMLVMAVAEAGIAFQPGDLQGLAATLTGAIWNQSYSNPMFTNYIEGGNSAFGTLPPWANGNVFLGWDSVGRCSPLAQRVLAVAFQDIMTNPSQILAQNPSLAANANSYGKVELAGTLARNVAP